MDKITKKIKDYFGLAQDLMLKKYKDKTSFKELNKKDRKEFFKQVSKIWNDKHKDN